MVLNDLAYIVLLAMSDYFANAVASVVPAFVETALGTYSAPLHSSKLYVGAVDTAQVLALFSTIYSQLSNVTLCISDEFTTIPPTFNVTPMIWVLIATTVDPSLFSTLIENTQLPIAYQFDAAAFMGIVNSIPDSLPASALSNMTSPFASIHCRSATLNYIQYVMYASIMKASLRGNETPYLLDFIPNVLAPIDFPAWCGTFRAMAPYTMDEPRILDALQRLSGAQVAMVASKAREIMMGANQLQVGSVLERVAYLVVSPASVSTALAIVTGFPRFNGKCSELMTALIYTQGTIALFELWALLYKPCCRLTYQPLPFIGGMPCGGAAAVCYPSASYYYMAAVDACKWYKAIYATIDSFLYDLVFRLYGPKTAERDGVSIDLSGPQAIACCMLSDNPFGTKGLPDTEISTPDHALLLTSSGPVFQGKKLYAWSDTVMAQKYENRVMAAEAYNTFLLAYGMIENDQAEAFAVYIAATDNETYMWLHGIA